MTERSENASPDLSDEGIGDYKKINNRIAQREFRKRKQQYIKDLEARVALFDSGSEEQVEKLRAGMRALMEENNQLRSLLKDLAGFVGAGLGGQLASGGIDIKDFQHLVNRGPTDSIHNAFANMNVSPQPNPLPPTNGTTSSSNNRPSNPLPRATAPIITSYPPIASPSSSRTSFASNSKPSPSSPSSSHPVPSNFQTTPSDLMGSLVSQHPHFVLATDYLRETARKETGTPALGAIEDLYAEPSDNMKLQAIQMISYHMKNKRESPAYHLPPSLKATVVQETIPHSPFFDGIIFHSLRDRLILAQDQLDVPALIVDLIDALVIHSNDILLPSSWELRVDFLKKYWFCLDSEVLGYTNTWRKSRGEKVILMNDIVPK